MSSTLTEHSAVPNPWWRNWHFWLSLVLPLPAILFALDFGFFVGGSYFGTAQPLPNIALAIGLILSYVGLVVQQLRAIPGIYLVTIGLVLVGASATLSLLFGYLVLCYETWFIASRITRHRRRWLTAILVGSALTIVVNYVVPTSYYISDRSDSVAYTRDTIAIFGLLALFAVLVSTASTLFFWQLGTTAFKRTMRMHELEARAELAALTERSRIAREMHDIIAHSLTVVIAQADGGRFAAQKSPEKAIAALETISRVSRTSLAQMRSLLSVLNDPTEARSTAASPGIANIGELIKEAQAAGLTVHYHVTGTPLQLEESLDLSLFRVVQESLTNALKHADGAALTLTLDWGEANTRPRRLTLTAHNPPTAQTPQPAAALPRKAPQIPGSGKGLKGIASRAKLHGGNASWGPATQHAGGFTLTFTVPITERKPR